MNEYGERLTHTYLQFNIPRCRKRIKFINLNSQPNACESYNDDICVLVEVEYHYIKLNICMIKYIL